MARAGGTRAEMRTRELRNLSLIVAAVVAARVGLARAAWGEFAGWFDHVYYYLVQVREVVETGRLAFADMPLLFRLDAAVARVLVGLGVDGDTAVEVAVRGVMCLAVGILPIAMLGIVRGLAGGAGVRPRQWVLVVAAGFLPLTLVHLPGTSQKNLLGLVWMLLLIEASGRLFRRPRAATALWISALAVAIVLTHFGTVAAMGLWGVACALADALVRRSPRRLGVATVALGVCAVLAALAIRLIDPRRFHRLLEYAADSLSGSLVAAPFTGGRGVAGIAASLAAILVFYAVLARVAGVSLRRDGGASTPCSDRAFGLANVLFCALLVLPLLDERAMGRLAVFVPLPLMVVAAFLEENGAWKGRWKTAGVAMLAAVTALLAVGEVVSERVRATRRGDVAADLERLRDEAVVGPQDLVLARTGAEHVANWFLRAPASVITALEVDDFSRYASVLVLVPAEGRPLPPELRATEATSEANRYRLMLHDVPVPASAEPSFHAEGLSLHRLPTPPPEWRFATDGRFLAYGSPPPLHR